MPPVKPGQTLYLTALVNDPEDGAPMNADALPTGILYRNLVALLTTVTVTNLGIGRYGFQVTIPVDWVAADGGSLIAAAVVDGVTYYASVDFVIDTKRISDLQDITAANVRTQADAANAAYDGPTNAEMIARTLPAASYATSAALLAMDASLVNFVASGTVIGTITINYTSGGIPAQADLDLITGYVICLDDFNKPLADAEVHFTMLEGTEEDGFALSGNEITMTSDIDGVAYHSFIRGASYQFRYGDSNKCRVYKAPELGTGNWLIGQFIGKP